VTGAAILAAGVVVAVWLTWLHRQRPLAERLVDVLYRRAHRADAMAHAADDALVRYRERRAELMAEFVPKYIEEAR
jgi:hypothetical protein